MTKPSATAVIVQPEYRQFVEELKARVISAHTSAARAVNRSLILLYWDIGHGIFERQQVLGWGESVIDKVSADLQQAFPTTTGFSPRNLRDMKRLYLAYADEVIWRQAVAKLPKGLADDAEFWRQAVANMQSGAATDTTSWPRALVAAIPWGHHLLILNKLTDPTERVWYIRAAMRFGWTRNVLLNQIKANAYARAVTDQKSHNFTLTLPEHLAEQADEMLKSAYSLEFLGLRGAVKERELEDRLISRLQAFLLELGYGFCFVGRQHRLKLGQKEYFIDLLFYHRHLKALVAFELKVGAFEPEHAGKMDFYLNLLNDLERGDGDQSAIGIILCAEKDDVEVEYALRSKANPIGVATYQLQTTLPPALKGKLPTVKQLADVVQATLAQGGD
jgi:predicted nuclease of restriction endonuclease-like (RecB) superfamily